MTAAGIDWMLNLGLSLGWELVCSVPFVILTVSQGGNHTIPILQRSRLTQKQLRSRYGEKTQRIQLSPGTRQWDISLLSLLKKKRVQMFCVLVAPQVFASKPTWESPPWRRHGARPAPCHNPSLCPWHLSLPSSCQVTTVQTHTTSIGLFLFLTSLYTFW